MIKIPFIMAEAGFAAIWLAIRLALWAIRKRINWKREALLLLMFINLAVIIRFTFFPMARAGGRVQPLVFDTAAVFPFKLNPIPFVNLFNYDSRSAALLNVIGNAAMFIPSGIVLPTVYKRLDTFLKVLFAGAAISVFIEILQLPFVDRTTDIDDLILNTVGVAIGYGIYAFVRTLKKAKRHDIKESQK